MAAAMSDTTESVGSLCRKRLDSRGLLRSETSRATMVEKGETMNHDHLQFRVAQLSASIPDGVPVEWQGRSFSSGLLTIDLDADGTSHGVLDYRTRRASAEFYVLLRFPELAETLSGLGVDAAWTRPVRAVLRSEGDILEDHGFALSGRCHILPHAMFAPGSADASVLPGH